MGFSKLLPFFLLGGLPELMKPEKKKICQFPGCKSEVGDEKREDFCPFHREVMELRRKGN